MARLFPGLLLFAGSVALRVASSVAADPAPPPVFAPETLPIGKVRVEILELARPETQGAIESAGGNDSPPPAPKAPAAKEDAGRDASWGALPTVLTEQYATSVFAFGAVPEKYNARGIKIDRSHPFLVRAAAVIKLSQGKHRLLLRSLGSARLAIDGQQIAMTEHVKKRVGDDEPVPDPVAEQRIPAMRALPPGHKEALAEFDADGEPHVVTLEAFVGGKLLRPEIGELSVSAADGERERDRFFLLAPGPENPISADEEGWRAFGERQQKEIAALNAERRRIPEEEAYWRMRHALAREKAPPPPPIPSAGQPDSSSAGAVIDAFIKAKLPQNSAEAPLVGDASFLRRVTLDTIGLVPAPEEVRAFLADHSSDKRARAIDRLLADTRSADHWTSYWQDVLAENPNMLKGTLNNTGPFRWWIHESLLDNKPIDRFVTELVGMQGSAQFGGPAGFGLATQNDLPMAAKAQIVSSAFLAMEMKCARCHDAPFHPFDQGDLFSIAAMLQRAPITVPGSSLTRGLPKDSHVTVTLKAGEKISAHWPFSGSHEPLPGVIRNANDSRELLAAIITDPRNERFAQVVVNRLWKQLIGVGIVEPVDDWENAAPSHKELIAWLAHELVTHDYDLKHLARAILTSRTYQRVASSNGARIGKSGERTFAAPARRRMTAEQLVDSLFAISGKMFDTEMLTMDPEGRQVANDQGNFGRPQRAWQFAALSNERDRPALAKPRAQIIADVLAAFGWRESRAEPRSTRDHAPNVLQPALLANGALGGRIGRLSEESAFTALALKDQPVRDLVSDVFVRVLSRLPATDEVETFAALLVPGYETRRTGVPPAPPKRRITKAVSWANHLNPEATNVVLAIEKEVQGGDIPTARLTPEWREQMEDMIWALLISPEFIHLP
jgi:hypothetical protein